MHPLPARQRDAICPNCSAAICSGDHYCSACGQKTRYRPRSLRAMLQDIAGRDFAPDGRLGLTLKALLIPGELTVEWFAGRQQRYLGPVRLLLLLMLAVVFVLQLTTRSNLARAPDPERGTPIWSFVYGADHAPAVLQVHLAHTRVEVRVGALAPLLQPLAARVQSRLADLSERELRERLLLKVVPAHSYGLLLIVPLVIVLLALSYAGTGRRLAEHTVFVLHWCSFGLLAALCLQLPIELLLQRSDRAQIAFAVVVTLWFALGVQNYYRGTHWVNALRVLAVAAMTWLIEPYIDALVALVALG
ncbi:MAG: DUF3667 domain-containing protein [Betaproteobacteria bacterium]|jgi:hypothetical protein